ncbi:hypothetical protein GCM10027572_36100 [Flexivirga lutea]
MADNWREQAACRGENPELFFPVGTSGPALQQIERAKEICRHCPVAAQCLAAALAGGEDAGIWGGLTAEERRALKRGRARRAIRFAELSDQPGGDDPADADDAAELSRLPIGGRSGESRTGWARRTRPAQQPRQERSARTARRA